MKTQQEVIKKTGNVLPYQIWCQGILGSLPLWIPDAHKEAIMYDMQNDTGRYWSTAYDAQAPQIVFIRQFVSRWFRQYGMYLTHKCMQ